MGRDGYFSSRIYEDKLMNDVYVITNMYTGELWGYCNSFEEAEKFRKENSTYNLRLNVIRVSNLEEN